MTLETEAPPVPQAQPDAAELESSISLPPESVPGVTSFAHFVMLIPLTLEFWMRMRMPFELVL